MDFHEKIKPLQWQADVYFKQIIVQIKEFEATLDSEHEIGISLANFGKQQMLHIESIACERPGLLYFYGYLDGIRTQLIQHISQTNLVLSAVPKEPSMPAKRVIGFVVES